MEVTKNIYCVKDEGIVDHRTVTREGQEISLGLQEPRWSGKVRSV